MAVAYKMRFEGATLEQYDRVIELMGFTRTVSAPNGGVFHWSAKTDDGIVVVDVWESDEQFNRFAEEQIGPIHAEAGVPASAYRHPLRRAQHAGRAEVRGLARLSGAPAGHASCCPAPTRVEVTASPGRCRYARMQPCSPQRCRRPWLLPSVRSSPRHRTRR